MSGAGSRSDRKNTALKASLPLHGSAGSNKMSLMSIQVLKILYYTLMSKETSGKSKERHLHMNYKIYKRFYKAHIHINSSVCLTHHIVINLFPLYKQRTFTNF